MQRDILGNEATIKADSECKKKTEHFRNIPWKPSHFSKISKKLFTSKKSPLYDNSCKCYIGVQVSSYVFTRPWPATRIQEKLFVIKVLEVILYKCILDNILYI